MSDPRRIVPSDWPTARALRLFLLVCTNSPSTACGVFLDVAAVDAGCEGVQVVEGPTLVRLRLGLTCSSFLQVASPWA